MAPPDTPSPSPLLFINFRHDDSGPAAFRLAAELSRELDPSQVFIDRSSIEHGSLWPEELRGALARCTVFVSLIGKKWHLSQDPVTGEQRLRQEGDWVRTEIEQALARKDDDVLDIYPLYVDQKAPGNEIYPDSIAGLSEIQGHELRTTPPDWDRDVAALIGRLRQRGFGLGAGTAIAEPGSGPGSRTGFVTPQTYRRLVAERAQRAFQTLGPLGQDALAQVFVHLIRIDERGQIIHRPAPLERVAAQPGQRELVDALSAPGIGLLVRTGDGDPATVEIGHDALTRAWQPLAHWIEAHADDLRSLAEAEIAARKWQRQGRPAADLWPQERLERIFATLTRLGIPDPPGPLDAFLRPEAARLIAELRDSALPHARRAWIGDRLAHLGDARPGVGLSGGSVPFPRWEEVRQIGLPGPIAGHGDADTVAVVVAKRGTLRVRPFLIARYPVTNAQLRAFILARDGARNAHWWRGIPGSKASWPEVPHLAPANGPAINLNWYDALAFCRWLGRRLGTEIRLPSEEEWQLAATGNQPYRVYPWGQRWQDSCANTSAAGLGRSTAVGMYPDGGSPCGALDMAGNVCEWTSTPSERDTDKRIVRGGSWYQSAAEARARARNHVYAFARLEYCGFRIACDELPQSDDGTDTVSDREP